jgi:ATP-dependent Clp protease adaptor protein ClpS
LVATADAEETVSEQRELGTRGDVLTRTRTERKLARPRLFRVLLHNDDFTPREFVVVLLQQIFHHSEVEATRIMLWVHNHGIGVVGVYPHAVAETKVSEVLAEAQKAEYPLLATFEPEDDGTEE